MGARSERDAMRKNVTPAQPRGRPFPRCLRLKSTSPAAYTRPRVETTAAALLIAVPIVFNVAFFELGRAFDYPDILRREPDEILRRFDAGGAGPAPPLAGCCCSARWRCCRWRRSSPWPRRAAGPDALAIVVGATAALVQALGLVRWPFAVPELARRYVAAAPAGAAEADATRGRSR